MHIFHEQPASVNRECAWCGAPIPPVLIVTRAGQRLDDLCHKCAPFCYSLAMVHDAPEDFDAPPVPQEPTTAPAGSFEKVAAMAARRARKEQLFHPDDNRDTHRPLRDRRPVFELHVSEPFGIPPTVILTPHYGVFVADGTGLSWLRETFDAPGLAEAYARLVGGEVVDLGNLVWNDLAQHHANDLADL